MERRTTEQPRVGVGVPALLRLHLFGEIVHETFGHRPVLVGSVLLGKTWRDVDVRLLLPAEDYSYWVGELTRPPRINRRWVGLTMAFSALAVDLTGLPIDFQLDELAHADRVFPGALRVPLGLTAEAEQQWIEEAFL